MTAPSSGLRPASPQGEKRKGGKSHISIRDLTVAVSVITLLAGCSGTGPSAMQENADAAPSGDVAVRSTPVVAGRPARVFIFAGLGDKCEPLAAPQIEITSPPSKGDVSFVPGQQTTIQTSAKGTCIGHLATGTGVYYTARAGALGPDRFTVTAKLAKTEAATRTFEVTVAE